MSNIITLTNKNTKKEQKLVATAVLLYAMYVAEDLKEKDDALKDFCFYDGKGSSMSDFYVSIFPAEFSYTDNSDRGFGTQVGLMWQAKSLLKETGVIVRYEPNFKAKAHYFKMSDKMRKSFKAWLGGAAKSNPAGINIMEMMKVVKEAVIAEAHSKKGINKKEEVAEMSDLLGEMGLI